MSAPFRPGEIVTVRAYAGHRADAEPRVIVVGGREFPIDEVVWRATEQRGGERRRAFVVRAAGVRVRISVGEDDEVWRVDRLL